ncbi:MAG: alpha/beta hydrolase [Micrococcales bacterium]|nr:alpha/beta hydrolase [Micrococcales bacterium]
MLGRAAVLRYLRRSIYPAPAARPVELPAGAEIVRTDGTEPAFAVHAAAAGDACTVVYFHGNGEQLSDTGSLRASIVDAGLGFVAVEYPGYGLAAAQDPSEANLYRAAAAMLDHLHGTRGLHAERTVLLGHSLGTAVAVEMATRGYACRLVLSAPFTSTADMVRHLTPYLPAGLIAAGERLDSLAKAPRVEVPTLLIHGAQDEVVPVWMSATLTDNLRHAHRVVLPGRGHNDVEDAISRAAVIAATEPPERWAILLTGPRTA